MAAAAPSWLLPRRRRGGSCLPGLGPGGQLVPGVSGELRQKPALGFIRAPSSGEQGAWGPGADPCSAVGRSDPGEGDWLMQISVSNRNRRAGVISKAESRDIY